MMEEENEGHDITEFGREDPRPPCQLYLITPPKIVVQDFVKTFRQALEGGAVAALQLRLKDVADDEILKAAEALLPVCEEAEVALIINDRADLAKKSGAEGVHLGQTDGSVAAARTLLGADKTIGVTCHDSRHLAMEAGEAGADYVAFGAFYPTATKQAPTQADPEILTWWVALSELPCVAIGGITPENAAPLIEAGADFLAVSAGVWAHPEGPAAAVAAFNRLFGTA
ncbi:thiamine phosphate synthase [Pedomonas mirosovicensis]|uniref:thiamine phosphate synthase n=1 Tax=Pedomonas mirosovicensis TaxID=2908641 RepID=UPI00216835D4|nr:thiamine phosphate synthase [Pedomonas mirosovicensis]MCH8685359.1 thiamine phosphate synthase [Pedomonas mirosovicensis]